MAFEHFEAVGQRAGAGAKEADAGPPAGAEIEPREIVEALAHSLVDEPVGRAAGRDHVAEGGEGLGRERLGADHLALHGSISPGWRLTSL